MKRIVLTVTVVIFTLIFAISAYSHDFTSNDFWQNASQWYSINASASSRIDSAQFRYMYYDYTDSTDTCFGLNLLINDNTKLNQSSLDCTGFDITFYNSSGESLDYFRVFANEGEKQQKGKNGFFNAASEAINAYKGSVFRFYSEYHSLSKFAQSDTIYVKVQIFDSESLALLSAGNELSITVPRLSVEPSTTKKTSKSQKSSKAKKNSKTKKSAKQKAGAKSDKNKKKRYYYASTTASKYNAGYGSKSKSYYSSGKNSKSKVSTTKPENNKIEDETEVYSKADIVELEENEPAMNNKQVIAISVISALVGCVIAVIILLIIKKYKHNSSVDDNKSKGG